MSPELVLASNLSPRGLESLLDLTSETHLDPSRVSPVLPSWSLGPPSQVSLVWLRMPRSLGSGLLPFLSGFQPAGLAELECLAFLELTLWLGSGLAQPVSCLGLFALVECETFVWIALLCLRVLGTSACWQGGCSSSTSFLKCRIPWPCLEVSGVAVLGQGTVLV